MVDEEKIFEDGSPVEDKSFSNSRSSKEIDAAHESRASLNASTSRPDDHTTKDVEGGPPPVPTPNGHDPSLVGWDGPLDPENPMHWSVGRKIWMSAMASFMTFGVSFASSIFSADTEVTAKKFNVSEEVMVLGVSLYVLGFCLWYGPLVFGPISELYGRSKPLLIGFLCFAIFNIPVAVAQNLETVLVCRFLSAAFGAAPVAIAPGILVDLWAPYPRGIATLLWATTVFAGPTVGPIIGEFTVKNENLGWRWTMWFTLIMAMTIFLISLPTCSETFAPILLQRKAARLRFQTKNWALHSHRDEQPISYGYLARKYSIKPLQMLVQEPILMAMTAFMSLVYALIYLTFFAFPYSFSVVRHWPTGISSLPFVSLFIGYLLGFALSLLESRFRYHPLEGNHHPSPVPPEQRLPPMMLGALILIVGLFWFAWTSSETTTWVPQVVAGVPIGCGVFMVFMPGNIYLMDVYTVNAASALAGNAFVRASLACAFPLFAGPMYSRLGVQWATSVLGFICIALSPCPVIFHFYGKKLRAWSRFVVD